MIRGGGLIGEGESRTVLKRARPVALYGSPIEEVRSQTRDGFSPC
ncbi:hypothetical protein [uncultured Enterovirga sp.]